MLTYVIVVNDNGELKTITEEEINALDINLEHGYSIEAMLNDVLETRAADNPQPAQFVHHKDGDPTNNAPDNLEMRTRVPKTAQCPNCAGHGIYDAGYHNPKECAECNGSGLVPIERYTVKHDMTSWIVWDKLHKERCAGPYMYEGNARNICDALNNSKMSYNRDNKSIERNTE